MTAEFQEWEEDSLNSSTVDAKPWRSALTVGIKNGRALYYEMTTQIEEWDEQNVKSESAGAKVLCSGLGVIFEKRESGQLTNGVRAQGENEMKWQVYVLG